MKKLKDCLFAHDMNNHDMLCNDNVCHDINNSSICYESCHEDAKLSKSDWFYLVNQLEAWRVFAPRAVVKKNPALAWRIMTLCRDASVRVPGAYFTACFRRELAKLQNAHKIEELKKLARQKLGIA